MLILPRISLDSDEVVAGFEVDCHPLLVSGAATVAVDVGNYVIEPVAEYEEHDVEFRVTGVKGDGLNVRRPNREVVDVFGSG